MKEALMYEPLADGYVRCILCAHRCTISPDGRGICQVRENRDGILTTLVYGELIARHVDPIEKKPLFHYYPGSRAYSIATAGCNFRCDWCQNFDISQMPRDQRVILGDSTAPEDVVAAARAHRCCSIAYTYTEPTIFFETTLDIARLAHAAGIGNVYVTNGYMTSDALEMIRPYLDAANVDLKAFSDATYRRHIGARLQPVLDSLKLMKRLGIWVEVTTLVIPDLNDDPDELREAAQFIAQELGPETPWHLSRFHPAYKLNTVPPTPESTVARASEIAKEAGLRYVYAGNSRQNADTTCHACGALLIQRSGYAILRNRVTAEGACPNCSMAVAGLGMNGESSG
ncbi:MAG: AmmeMemoRadiSam system radical SAM enzyme [Anaerolineae bacterium]|nr:AmmeMemoRadiSam system radical SAM enzyme [Anaerolineae bacterium]